MAGARIEDDERPLIGIDHDIGGRDDAHQGVIHGFRQGAPVDKHLGFEIEHMRRRARALNKIVVSAPAHNVEKQDGALAGVAPIVEEKAA